MFSRAAFIFESNTVFFRFSFHVFVTNDHNILSYIFKTKHTLSNEYWMVFCSLISFWFPSFISRKRFFVFFISPFSFFFYYSVVVWIRFDYKWKTLKWLRFLSLYPRVMHFVCVFSFLWRWWWEYRSFFIRHRKKGRNEKITKFIVFTMHWFSLFTSFESFMFMLVDHKRSQTAYLCCSFFLNFQNGNSLFSFYFDFNGFKAFEFVVRPSIPLVELLLKCNHVTHTLIFH